MKDESQLNSKHHRNTNTPTIKKYIRPAAYFMLFILCYTFGYLSAANYSITVVPPRNTNAILETPPPTTVNVTAAVAVAVAVPSTKTMDIHQFRVAARCSTTPIPPPLIRQTILQYLFNNTSPYTNFPPAHVSHLIRPTRIKGWGSTGLVFENLIRKTKPNTIIEVGTFLGASALHMAHLTRSLGFQTQILCVDDFRGWAGFKTQFKDMPLVNGDVLLLYQFMQNVISMNKTDSVLPIPFSTSSALDMLCELGVKGDLIEIDAGHDFLSAWSDINRAYRLLTPGGVLFGHDYFTSADNHGVRRAVNLFARVNGFRVRVDGQHWVIDSS